MKKFIVALMVLTSLVSCGKNNSVGSTATSASSTNALTVTGTVETQLGSLIDNNQFGTGQASYYETWTQVVTNMPGLTYKYGSVNTSSNCRTVGYIFQICSSSSSSNVSISRSVVHSSVVLLDKQNELKAIVNARSLVQQGSATSFYVRTTDGRQYIIDTRYPIQANPVSIQQANGTGEVFLRAE